SMKRTEPRGEANSMALLGSTTVYTSSSLTESGSPFFQSSWQRRLRMSIHSLRTGIELHVILAVLGRAQSGSLPAAKRDVHRRIRRGLIHLENSGICLIEKGGNQFIGFGKDGGGKP